MPTIHPPQLSPKSISGLGIYNGYNLKSTYDTFLYLFNKVKKGIYISIKDNELQTYLPFSNINYKNNWANVLKDLNPETLNFLKSRFYNVSDPEFWYANNCFFNTNKLKFTSDDGKGKGKGKSKGKGGRGKEYLEEGDKTETIFKYFLKYFLEDLNKQEKKINDLDFFFSPNRVIESFSLGKASLSTAIVFLIVLVVQG